MLVNAPCRVAVRPDAVGAKDQRSVRRAGTYVHSPPPVAPLHVAPDAPAPRYNSTATLSSAAARGENVSSNVPGRGGFGSDWVWREFEGTDRRDRSRRARCVARKVLGLGSVPLQRL